MKPHSWFLQASLTVNNENSEAMNSGPSDSHAITKAKLTPNVFKSPWHLLSTFYMPGMILGALCPSANSIVPTFWNLLYYYPPFHRQAK